MSYEFSRQVRILFSNFNFVYDLDLMPYFDLKLGTKILLQIDHTRKELRFIFRDSEGDMIKKDITSLSGGEKSYAQVKLDITKTFPTPSR